MYDIYKLTTKAPTVSVKSLPPSGSGFLISMTRVPLLLLCSLALLLFPRIAAQPGFINIDCGSSSNYTDSNTGLIWTTDDGYISTGSNQKVTSSYEADNYKQTSTARYFQKSRTKNCYILPATFNNSYLVRAFFLYGDLDSSPPSNYSFSLSIDSTIADTVSITESDVNVAQSFEYFVASTSKQIAFCVIPVVGNPFISSLELRLLLPTMYGGVMFGSKYLSTLVRFNCGANSTDPTVRYPDDTYDRLWHSPGSNYKLTSKLTSISTTATNFVSDAIDDPPDKVMQTAWTNTKLESIWFTWPFKDTSTAKFYGALYFVEIGKRNATDVRSIDIYFNDQSWYVGLLNLTQVVTEIESIRPAAWASATNYANFTLLPNKVSSLPPILNAAEMYAVYDTVITTTYARDVSALYDLRQSLNLLDWTGDPCLPVAFDWLNCSNRVPPTITQLKLSGYQLTGTIPPSIAGLSDLTDLWLDNNFLTGFIPSLAGLTRLRTLHLQNNSLTGSIPTSLGDTPNLSELFLKDNQLSGPIPATLLSKPGLNLQVDTGLNSSQSPSGNQKKKSGMSGALIGAIIGVIILILLIPIVLFFWYRIKNKAKTQPQLEIDGNQTGTYDKSRTHAIGTDNHHVKMTRAFSQKEVQDATNNFKRKIGEGGFGPVYYGRLASREEVAVKVNSATSRQGSIEFSTEVNLLSRVHHQNLVSLVGFCDEGDEKILLYEYMQNGTLREHLYGKGLVKRLDWQTRLDIALNAARGLEYLHYGCSPKIIHRDIKSTNILLNEKLLAKVADFGISKQTLDEDTTIGVSTIVRGTTGYLDPEYFSTNKLTYKSDVYAFGVVLLEIISGRAPNDNKLVDTFKWNLIEYARGMLRESNLAAIVDSSLFGNYNVESMWKLAELAMCCVEPNSTNRPDIRQVVTELIETIDLEKVRQPAMVSSTYASVGDVSSLVLDDTQSSYPSYPSTQSSQPKTSPDTHNYHNYTTNDLSALHSSMQRPSTNSDSWNKPKAR